MRSRYAALVCVLALVVAGCGPVAQPTVTTPPPSSSEATPTPTPTPEPQLTVVIRSTGIEVRDDGGATVDSHGWFDDPAETIGMLSETFGTDPTEVPWEGHIEAQPGTDYTWSGFVFRVQDAIAQPPDRPNTSALSTVSDVGDVHVQIDNGLTVGSTLTDVLGANPLEAREYVDDAGTWWSWYLFDPHELGVTGQPFTDSVGLRTNLDTEVVTEIFATLNNYGP
jgi:hypothetical protein